MNDIPDRNGTWLCCELCGKKLLKRLPNGLYELRFGALFPKRDLEKLRNLSGGYKNLEWEKVIELKIHGSISVKCLNRQCRITNPNHRNTFDFFPSKGV